MADNRTPEEKALAEETKRLRDELRNSNRDFVEFRSAMRNTQDALNNYNRAQSQLTSTINQLKSPFLTSIHTLFKDFGASNQLIATKKQQLEATKKELSLAAQTKKVKESEIRQIEQRIKDMKADKFQTPAQKNNLKQQEANIESQRKLRSAQDKLREQHENAIVELEKIQRGETSELQQSLTAVRDKAKEFTSAKAVFQDAEKQYLTTKRGIEQGTTQITPEMLAEIPGAQIPIKPGTEGGPEASILREILQEVAITRKITEGTLKFDTKTGQYAESTGDDQISLLASILREVTLIRNVTEGRITFDKRMGPEGQYRDTKTGQLIGAEFPQEEYKQKTGAMVGKETARAAGVGLYTKEELGEKLGLKKSEVSKSNIAELEERALVEKEPEKIAYQTALNKSAIDALNAEVVRTLGEAQSLQNAGLALESAYHELKKGSIEKQEEAIQSYLNGMINNRKAQVELEDGAIELVKAQEKLKTEGIEAVTKELEDQQSALQNLENSEKQLADKLKAQEESIRIEKWNKWSGAMSNASKAMLDLEAMVRKTQQQFGVSAGAAAKLATAQNIAAVKSIFTAGPRVSAEEIGGARQSFQGEFGGLISTEAATDLAKQAKEMGVTTEQLAKSRRVFMTQTMGDAGKAKATQDKFIGEFAKKGLTSKDAMEAIGKYSELMARNGTRFAGSFARAAADAKKIGVDLGKIDQVGDNIIGNFEGFLESQAELGAMGFGFDSSRLAEVAETGDTGALFNELRSQLASTGKDITKLRRSEQLALSQSFGISMEELQRMATGKTEGSGESMEDLQKLSNDKLGKILEAFTNGLGKVSGFLQLLTGAIQVVQTALLYKIAFNTAMGGMGGIGRAGRVARVAARRGMRTIGRAGRAVTRGAGSVISGAGRAARAVTGGVGTVLSGAGRAARAVTGGVGTVLSGAGRAARAVTGGAGSAISGVGRALRGVGRGARGLAGRGVSGVGRALRGVRGLAGGAARVAPRLGSIAKFGTRALGKVALPLTAALSAFDAYKGFTADKDASTGQKLKNAGSSVLSGLTFGLLGKDASEISAASAAKKAATPGTIPSGASGLTAATTALTTSGVVTSAQPAAASGTPSTPAIQQAVVAARTGTSTSPPTPPAPVINVDLSRLEAKLDAVVRAIGSMQVEMDGNKVGRILVNTSNAAISVGALRGTGT